MVSGDTALLKCFNATCIVFDVKLWLRELLPCQDFFTALLLIDSHTGETCKGA